jgi:hypothetical protein
MSAESGQSDVCSARSEVRKWPGSAMVELLCIECVETSVSNAVENCFAETTLVKELFFTCPNTQR